MRNYTSKQEALRKQILNEIYFILKEKVISDDSIIIPSRNALYKYPLTKQQKIYITNCLKSLKELTIDELKDTKKNLNKNQDFKLGKV